MHVLYDSRVDVGLLLEWSVDCATNAQHVKFVSRGELVEKSLEGGGMVVKVIVVVVELILKNTNETEHTIIFNPWFSPPNDRGFVFC